MGTTAAAGATRLYHLLPCPNCAADNGVTARVCWNCEAPLLNTPPRPSDFELQQQPPVAEPAAAGPAPELTVPLDELDPQLEPPDEPQFQPQPELQRRADPEPSFFPILHDEATDFRTAANDHPESELALQFMRRRDASRRLATGAVCAASVVMVLGTFLIVRSMTGNEEAELPAFASSTAPTSAAAPEATLVPTAYVTPPAVRPTIEPAAAAPLPKIAAPRQVEVPAAHAPPEPAAAEPMKAKRRAAAPAAVEVPAPPEPASCAPQVIALGLCGASSR
jgi:hypothetical protein